MGAHTHSEFNDLAKLFFKSFKIRNPDFDSCEFLKEFDSKNSNLERVNFLYDHMKKFPNVFAKFSPDNKNDDSALQHIENGKIKIETQDYWEAINCFTRSVSSAGSPKVLALAYGHRAGCFYSLNKPNECISDIERALSCYSEESTYQLLEMKRSAENMEQSPSCYFDTIPDREHFETNPSIQCANNCIEIRENNSGEKSIIATRTIEIGEILSIEKPFTNVLTADRLNHCHHCLTLCYNPIPCSLCTVALFCSQMCQENSRSYHKYECPILLTVCYRIMCEFAVDETLLLALKIAILAKDCQIFECDNSHYRSDRFKEIHLLKSKTEFDLNVFNHTILTSLVFELLWTHTSFFSSLFSSTVTQDRFKEIMLEQLQSLSTNSAKIYEYVHKYGFCGTNNFGLGAYSFFSLFPHSCCANTMKAYHGNTMVLRALSTIKRGEQCFVNRHGLRYDTNSKLEREEYLMKRKLKVCFCKACEFNWTPSLGNIEEICNTLNLEKMKLGKIIKNVIGLKKNIAKEFLPQLVEMLRYCESLEPEGNSLSLKILIVYCYMIFGNKRMEFDESRIVLEP